MPPPMMQPQSQDKPPVYDGQTDFSGGMDMSRSPELIAQNQIALGVNLTVRNGYPYTRPPFNLLTLDFAGDTDAEAWWHSHYFQGAAYYNVGGPYPNLIASVGGRIFNLRPAGLNFEVTDITPFKKDGVTLDPNSSILTKAYFCQAATYLIIQDGQSLPYIYDGSTLRRSNGSNSKNPEVPVGTIMAYGQGRLTVGFGNQFLVGDINGGATSVIAFTETTYLNGGGAFLLPMNMGSITGMIFTAQQDTNTGQGTLLVFGESGVISVNLNVPRTEWQNTQLVTVTLTDIGTLADRSLVTINADIFFRSQDGIRTYRDARAEFGQYSLGNYGRTALSYEIQPYLAADTLAYQKYISGIVFDNRYLMTTQPVARTNIGPPVFQAIAAMDFIPVSALRYNQAPVFDGFWTGLDFYQLVEGQFASGLRAFAFARNVDNAGNQLLQVWEITTGQGNDNYGSCPIQWALETRSFLFGSSLSYKRLQYLRVWADQLEGRVDWTVRLKPDQYPGWVTWQEWTDQAPDQTCLLDDCGPPNLQPQYRPGRNLTLAPESLTSNGATLTTARTAFSFQIRVEGSGVARFSKMILTGIPQDIPKVDCLALDPPDDPIANIIPSGTANQYFNTEVTYQCPAGTTGTSVTVPAGQFSSSVSVAAANAAALAYAMSQAVCTPLIPTVQSDTEKVGVSRPFSYQILATNSPTSYGATSLPAGLSLNTSTGLITGTISSTSLTTYTVGLSATNAAGTGTGTLTINVVGVLSVAFTQAGSAPNLAGVFVALDGAGYTAATFGTTYYAISQLKYKVVVQDGSYTGGNSINVSVNATFGDGGNHQTLAAGSSLSVYGTITPTSSTFLSYGDVQNGLANPSTWLGQSGTFSQTAALVGSTSSLTGSTALNNLTNEGGGTGTSTNYYTETIVNLP